MSNKVLHSTAGQSGRRFYFKYSNFIFLLLSIEIFFNNFMKTMASDVTFVKFNNGRQYPILGLGTWKSKPGEVQQAIKDAIDAGYRHFDCAHVYENQKEIGEAIAAKISEGVVKREDLYITSKLWNTFHKPELVIPALNNTLRDLGLEYLDLYLIHWPFGFKEGDNLFPTDESGKVLFSDTRYFNVWPKMEESVNKGLTKSIGISNFNKKQVDKILSIAQIKPVVNQVEAHPYLNQKELREYCNSRGIILTAYSPLGSPDRPWAKPGDPQLLDDPKLKSIGDKYSKSPAQVLIRYQIQQGNMVIPKSTNKSRIQSNIDVFDFELSSEDMKLLDSFDRNGRIVIMQGAKDHQDYPFN